MFRFYEEIWEIRDRRVDDWPLMNSMWPTFTICVAYVYYAKVLGPSIMKDRKPLQLQRVIQAYNLFQVIASAYMFISLMAAGWWSEYNYRCQDIDRNPDPNSKPYQMAVICWWCYLSKILDFADTFFFIAKKKFSHVSHLQVIHHSLMPMYGWMLVRFLPGGQETFGGTVNAFIHILMYSYYFLSSLGPSVQKYLWWKKYLTRMQILQFVIILIKCLSTILGFIECSYPWQFSVVTASLMVLFCGLFYDFYVQEYRKKVEARRKEEGQNKKID